MWNYCFKLYNRFRLIGFVITIAIYSFLGGLLFCHLESKHEIDMKIQKIESLNHAANNLSLTILSITENETNSKEIKFAEIQSIIKEYQKSEGLYPKDHIKWNLVGGMFFSGTVFTTIGYGNFHPETINGRIAVMIYAFFGIPMVLFIISEIGKSLTELLNIFWLKTIRLLKKKGIIKSSNNENSDVDENVKFPVLLATFIALSWNVICAGIFCTWEKSWSYFDSFYFFFISLSTIGFGDVIPEHYEYMICNPLVIIGLCLVAIVIHLMQSKLEFLKTKTGNIKRFGRFDNIEKNFDENRPATCITHFQTTKI